MHFLIIRNAVHIVGTIAWRIYCVAQCDIVVDGVTCAATTLAADCVNCVDERWKSYSWARCCAKMTIFIFKN